MSCCARIGSMFLVEKNLEPRLPCREQREARAAETEIWRDCQRSSTGDSWRRVEEYACKTPIENVPAYHGWRLFRWGERRCAKPASEKRRIQVRQPRGANLDSIGEQFAGEQADFTPLLDDRVYRSVRLSREFWLVNLKVKALQALAACEKPRFAEFDGHRSSSVACSLIRCARSPTKPWVAAAD